MFRHFPLPRSLLSFHLMKRSDYKHRPWNLAAWIHILSYRILEGLKAERAGGIKREDADLGLQLLRGSLPPVRLELEQKQCGLTRLALSMLTSGQD